MTTRTIWRGGLAGLGVGVCYALVALVLAAIGNAAILSERGIGLVALTATYLIALTTAGAIVGAFWDRLDSLFVRFPVYFVAALVVTGSFQLLIAGGPRHWQPFHYGLTFGLATFYTLGLITLKPER